LVLGQTGKEKVKNRYYGTTPEKKKLKIDFSSPLYKMKKLK
jgi:hypothetical protein